MDFKVVFVILLYLCPVFSIYWLFLPLRSNWGKWPPTSCKVCVLSILSVSATRRRLILIFGSSSGNSLRKKPHIYPHGPVKFVHWQRCRFMNLVTCSESPIVTIEMELKRVLGRRKPLYLPPNTLVCVFHVVDDENEAQKWVDQRLVRELEADSRSP